jgi:hypothetical protein
MDKYNYIKYNMKRSIIRLLAKKSFFKEYSMAKGGHGSSGGGGKSGGKGSAPRGGKGGSGFIPSRPGGNKPSTTGKPSGDGRGNLPPKP